MALSLSEAAEYSNQLQPRPLMHHLLSTLFINAARGTDSLQTCQACDLCGSKYGRDGYPPAWRKPTQKVPGKYLLPTSWVESWGPFADPGYCDLMLVGEGPGENEDKLGLPFMGSSGQFLDLTFKLSAIKGRVI